MPPSSWLSARITSETYLAVTTIMRDQKTSDTKPSTTSGLTIPPADLMHSRKV